MSKFESLRRKIKADEKKQHGLYVNNLVGDTKANPRDFYRYINSHKKDMHGIPPLKRRNGGGWAESELTPFAGCLRLGLSWFNWWVSFAPVFQCCYFCELSCLFYLSFNFDFYVSKIMHL